MNRGSTMITTRMTTHPLASTLDRFGTLNRVLDQMLPNQFGSAAPVWVPPLEVAERADAYLIAVDLPGVRDEDLELNFESNVLTLRGRKAPSFSAASEGEEIRVHVSERQAGSFERSVRLPEYVEGDRIDARFVDGVLHVTVPKSPAAQPRKIQLKRDAGARPQEQQLGNPAPAAESRSA
jgi:HSP20 family protein